MHYSFIKYAYYFGSNRARYAVHQAVFVKTVTAVFATSIVHSQNVCRKQNKRQSYPSIAHIIRELSGHENGKSQDDVEVKCGI